MLSNAGTARLQKDYTEDQRKQRKRDYLAALLLWETYNQSMAEAIAPTLYALLVETGRGAMQEIGMEGSQFNVIAPDVLDYYQQRALKIAQDVNAETEKQLRATLGQGVDEDDSDDELLARIAEVFGAALTYRADRIARTEVTRAQGFADVSAWGQSGLVSGKMWYTAQDERVCPFCKNLDGVITALNSDYYSLGDVIVTGGHTMNVNYDAVGNPPLHVSCRCVLMPVMLSLGE